MHERFEVSFVFRRRTEIVFPTHVGKSHSCSLRGQLLAQKLGVAAAKPLNCFEHDAMFRFLPDMVRKLAHGGWMLRVQTRANAQGAEGLALQLEHLLCLTLLGHKTVVTSLSCLYEHGDVR
jgi:hypothetical protein